MKTEKTSKIKFIVTLILIILLIMLTMMSGGNISNFIDPFSILFIIILSLLTITLSNQLSDYKRAIKIAIGSRDFTIEEYMISENAMKLSIKSIYMSGLLGTLISSIQIAAFSSSIEMTIASSRVAVLTLFYAIIINILQNAIKSTISKEIIFIKCDMEEDALEKNLDHTELSRREVEVFEEALNGLSNKEISDKLYIAESTVKKHMQNILKKTNCADRNVLINKYKTS